MHRLQATLAFLITIGATAWAQPASAPASAAPAARELSLKDAVSLAWEKSPVLQGIQAEVPAARARLEMARSGGRLLAATSTYLSTGTMMSNLPGVPPVMPGSILTVPNQARADQNLMLMYPLSTGGRVGAEVSGAGAEVRAAQAETDEALLQVAYQVRRDYWQVLLNQEMVKIAQENLKEQQERLRVDQVSFDAGKIPQYYLLRDKAEVATAEQELTNAQRDVDTALLRLRQDLGVSMDQGFTLTDALVYESGRPGEASLLTAEALKTRPLAQAARERVAAALSQVEAKRSTYRPQIAATVMAEGLVASGAGTRGGYTAAVVASLPLVDGGERAAAVAEAQAMTRRAEADRAGVDLEISRQVGEALLNFAAADRNVRTAEQAVASAEEDHRVALARYQAGKAINLEPIEALAALVRARTNYAQALFEQRVALDAVSRAVGRLPL